MIQEIPETAEALIFDLDGTLVDSTAVHFAAWHNALAEVGVKLDRGTFQELFGKNNPTIVREMERLTGRAIPLEQVSGLKDEQFARNVTMVIPNLEDSEAGLSGARAAGMSVTDVRPYL